jgi:LEA14-like dessication related protein
VVLGEPFNHLVQVHIALTIDDDSKGTFFVVLAQQDQAAFEPWVTHLRRGNEKSGFQPGTP